MPGWAEAAEAAAPPTRPPRAWRVEPGPRTAGGAAGEVDCGCVARDGDADGGWQPAAARGAVVERVLEGDSPSLQGGRAARACGARRAQQRARPAAMKAWPWCSASPGQPRGPTWVGRAQPGRQLPRRSSGRAVSCGRFRFTSASFSALLATDLLRTTAPRGQLAAHRHRAGCDSPPCRRVWARARWPCSQSKWAICKNRRYCR